MPRRGNSSQPKITLPASAYQNGRWVHGRMNYTPNQLQQAWDKKVAADKRNREAEHRAKVGQMKDEKKARDAEAKADTKQGMDAARQEWNVHQGASDAARRNYDAYQRAQDRLAAQDMIQGPKPPPRGVGKPPSKSDAKQRELENMGPGPSAAPIGGMGFPDPNGMTSPPMPEGNNFSPDSMRPDAFNNAPPSGAPGSMQVPMPTDDQLRGLGQQSAARQAMTLESARYAQAQAEHYRKWATANPGNAALIGGGPIRGSTGSPGYPPGSMPPPPAPPGPMQEGWYRSGPSMLERQGNVQQPPNNYSPDSMRPGEPRGVDPMFAPPRMETPAERAMRETDEMIASFRPGGSQSAQRRQPTPEQEE